MPEHVVWRGRHVPKTSDHPCNRNGLRIAGLGQDANASILCDRAGCPTVIDVCLEPRPGSPVMDVAQVEEGDQDVDVEESSQSIAGFFTQAVDQFVGDQDAAGWEGYESIERLGFGDAASSGIDFRRCCESTPHENGHNLAERAPLPSSQFARRV